jgi:hypothetical protein
MTGTTSEAETTNFSGPPEFTEKFVVPAPLVIPVMLLLNNTKHYTEN